MGKVRKKWTQEELENALATIRSGRSKSSVSKVTGIPRSTLGAKLSGKHPIGKSVGPPPVLSKDEENELIKWINYLSNRGFPVTKKQLVSHVQHLMKKLKRENPFKNDKPGRHWYEGFLRRHPEITAQITENLAHSRSSLNEQSLRKWFSDLKTHLDEKELTEIDKSRVFNCDEAAFYLCPREDHDIVRRGDKSDHNFTPNDENECLSTLFLTNANGTFAPPLILFSYERIPYSIAQGVPLGWALGKTDNGWMTSETFYKYITNVFEPWLNKNNIERPIILYVDGNASHFTLPVAEFCSAHDIQLFGLYPNATHVIQPLDVSLFRPLKVAWRNTAQEWRTLNQRKMRKEDFGTLLKKAVDEVYLENFMADGFRICGLHPFCPDAIQYDSLAKKIENIIVPVKTVSNVDRGKAKINLTSLEGFLGEKLLDDFKKCMETETWVEEVENRGLFSYWVYLKRLNSS